MKLLHILITIGLILTTTILSINKQIFASSSKAKIYATVLPNKLIIKTKNDIYKTTKYYPFKNHNIYEVKTLKKNNYDNNNNLLCNTIDY